MTIYEVAREAAALHMTYGQYVARFRPPGGRNRRCVLCGVDISGRQGPVRYCPACSDLARREHNRASAKRRRQLKKDQLGLSKEK